MSSPSESLKLDVAIVGAGAAGLYSAYRLLLCSPEANGGSCLAAIDAGGTQQKRALKVALFEASARLGGRVYSARFEPGNVSGEQGAMRYMSDQRIVTTLVNQVLSDDYNLKSVNVEYGGHENVLFYSRSRRFRSKELKSLDHEDGIGYRRSEKWRGKGVHDIYEDIVKEVLQADGYSLEHIRATRKHSHKNWDDMAQNLRYRFKGPFENRLVNQLAFWHVIADRVDSETSAFLKDADGYNCSFAELSATEGFQIVCDYTDSVEYRHVEGGFDRLYYALGAEIEKAGGRIWTNTRLLSFQRSSNRESLTAQPIYELKLFDERRDYTWTAYAENILLCIPRRSLELLENNSLLLKREEFRNKLKMAIPIPALKILLSFDEPWWEHILGLKGKTVTDLPLRQSYFFGATNPKLASSVVTATYVDSEAVVFWRCLQGLDHDEDHSNGELDSSQMSHPTSSHERANKTVISEVRRQMQAVLGRDVHIPEPTDSAFKDWGLDPFGGAYHFWKPGVKPWEAAREMRRPLRDERVFIAGECYSGLHGWVESAFLSAERVVRDEFGLAEPDWLKDGESYYLGW